MRSAFRAIETLAEALSTRSVLHPQSGRHTVLSIVGVVQRLDGPRRLRDDDDDNDWDSRKYGCEMGMESVMNSHGSVAAVGILWRFSYICEKRERIKQAINV